MIECRTDSPTEGRGIRPRGLAVALVLCALFATLLPAGSTPAHARRVKRTAQARPAVPANPLAVLIVGDETNKLMRRKEEAMVHLIRSNMKEQGLPKEVLPILTYHMNKPEERAYCEHYLKISRKQILFLGLAEHKNMVPSRVLVRENNVKDARSAVADLLKRTVAIITGVTSDVLSLPNPETVDSTPPPRIDSSSHTNITTAVMCHSVDGSGAPQDKTDVYAPEDTFFVSVEAYGLEIGTSLEAKWYHGQEVLHTSKITSDKRGDYYAWFSVSPQPSWQSGRYRVTIAVNGQPRTTVYFRVSAGE